MTSPTIRNRMTARECALTVLMLVALAWLLVFIWRGDAEWRADVAAANARHDALAALHRRSDSAAAARDSALEVRQRDLDAREAVLRARARETGADVVTLMDTIDVPAGCDSCKPILESLRLAVIEHLAADSMAALAIDSARAHLENRLTEMATRVDTLREQRDAAMQLAADNLKLARPSRFWQGVGVGAALVTGLVLLR